MSKHLFVVGSLGVLVLLFFACNSMSTIEQIGGRPHNVERSTLLGIPLSTKETVIKTDKEIEQDAKEATAKLKQDMERKVAEAKANAQAAKDKAKQFETRIGSLTKLLGFALLGLGILAHLFVSAPHLRSIATSVACSGGVVVLLGIVIKWTVGWELWLLLGTVALMAPVMYKLRKRGFFKPKENQDVPN